MKDMQKYSDNELLEMLRLESPMRDRSFDVIFNRYSSKFNAFCIFRSESREDAEEIFEDTWLNFLERVKKGFTPDNILPYLYQSARNLVIDKYRHKKSGKSIGIDYKDINDLENYVNPFDFSTQNDNEELISLIKVAVSSLDDIYKETFVMQWFGGLSQREIAEVIGISLSNVKMRSHRAMQELIKILRPRFAESSR